MKTRKSEPITTTVDATSDDLYETGQTRDLMRQICLLAATAIRITRERPNLVCDQDDDDREDRIQLLRQTLDRIGWVADVAARRMGGDGAFARAEDWMLPGIR